MGDLRSIAFPFADCGLWADELVVDGFAGGGGATTGIEQALGRPVDIAINHDAAALAVHAANHPRTQHFVSSIYDVDPLTATRGRLVTSNLRYYAEAAE